MGGRSGRKTAFSETGNRRPQGSGPVSPSDRIGATAATYQARRVNGWTVATLESAINQYGYHNEGTDRGLSETALGWWTVRSNVYVSKRGQVATEAS
jgi:hypothetical protein